MIGIEFFQTSGDFLFNENNSGAGCFRFREIGFIDKINSNQFKIQENSQRT